ncbi:HlyC/CorC family transporter [Micromonospora zingiberis]|uniref:HlyC/CorC family transporter n=1 Tax=Micromonospora zingiberis TaxID=2053011 RepID=A0A4R0FU50_9ACTN|nr:hemolysin family protein [Micromonospora zingiberis]TCB87390.1 HlyC/CorC family transporter [Micromonospora zingiberis]
MSNVWIVLVATVAFIALSAFFVAIEFALIAAKRHRLEDAAASSPSARAALRSSTELTVLLAGSQLGITVCTLALGAVTKPAVHHWLTPLFESWGVVLWLADVAGFALALIIVTFLHLVVGEMAPKSWAIAHPERSATLLAIPMRAFMWLTRPLLRGLNDAANWCLRRIGVEPVDQVANGLSPDTLRHLVEHSANVGALDAGYSSQLTVALELQSLLVRDLVNPRTRPTSVPSGATVADVQAAARNSSHLRILVGDDAVVTGVVHVRDTLNAPPEQSLAPYTRPAFRIDAETPVHVALTKMRETRNHLVAVTDGGQFIGVITLADVLRRLLPTAGPLSNLAAAATTARTA